MSYYTLEEIFNYTPDELNNYIDPLYHTNSLQDKRHVILVNMYDHGGYFSPEDQSYISHPDFPSVIQTVGTASELRQLLKYNFDDIYQVSQEQLETMLERPHDATISIRTLRGLAIMFLIDYNLLSEVVDYVVIDQIIELAYIANSASELRQLINVSETRNFDTLTPGLKVRLCYLTEFVTEIYDNMEENDFYDTLAVDTFLKTIDLSYVRINDNTCFNIAHALRLNSTLENLNLRGNMIHSHGAAMLGSGLESNGTLKSLNLDDNNIDSDGASAIFTSLIRNVGLKTLYLSGNIIDSTCLIPLAELLAVSETLEKLDLSRNQITNLPPQFIDALKTNTTFKSLNLSYNDIGTAGAELLADVIRTNTSLSSLYLNGINMTVDGVRMLLDALNDNLSLRILEVNNQGLHPEFVILIGLINQKLEANKIAQNINLALLQSNIIPEGTRSDFLDYMKTYT